MHLAVFDNAFFLQSLGWAIANSIWQAGLLWLLYNACIAANKKSSAVYKHNLGMVLIAISFSWFFFTLFSTYYSISNSPVVESLFFNNKWSIRWQYLNNYLPFFSLLYLALLCVYGRRFFSSYTKTGFIQNNGLIKPPACLRVFTLNTALHLGIKRKVQVWISEHIDVPSMIGFIKPVILLPAAALNDLTIQQVEAILLHELVHIKRHDYLLNILQSFIELILFFNPFIALLNNSIRKEREHCCDDWVMNYRYNNHDYANALLLLEEQRRQQLLLTVAATNGKKNLLNRIKRLFNTEPQVNISARQKIQLAFLSIFLFFGILILLPALPGINSYGSSLAVTENTPAIPLSTPLLTVAVEPVTKKEFPSAIVNNKQVIKTKEENIALVKKVARKLTAKKVDEEIAIALINEELLNGNTNADFKLEQVTCKEEDPNSKQCIVKLEEERSGKTNKTTYYFELKNSNGKTTYKPLLFLNKPHPKKPAVKKLNDTAVNPPKRITS